MMNDEFPDMVYEAYDTIEKLLYKKEDNLNLANSNLIASECLLFILDTLYKTIPQKLEK